MPKSLLQNPRNFSLIFIIVFALQVTAQNVILISSFEDLCKIGKDEGYPLNGHYELTNDIDASSSNRLNYAGAYERRYHGFLPIGNDSLQFTGTFNGKGFIINGLYINRNDYVGLFGYTNGAVITDVHIVGDSISGNEHVGGLVGRNENSTISRCSFTGFVRGAHNYVGGLVGRSYQSDITGSHTVGDVRGRYYVGGLVGNIEGNCVITQSYAKNDVIGSFGVGGLVGYADTTTRNSAITDCYSTGSVRGSAAGGIISGNYGTITKCYATGNVTAADGNNIGGLVGTNNGTITGSHATGNVEISGGDAGGLVGYNGGSITQCYATGDVSRRGDFISSRGGLVGRNGGSITQSYATGNVIQGGGLVSVNDGTITECYAAGYVDAIGSSGGLVRWPLNQNATTIRSYWDIIASSKTESEGGTGKTTEDMKKQATYEDWDFDLVWQIDENMSYPYFRTSINVATIKNRIAVSQLTAPHITVKGKTLNVLTASNSDLQIRLFDMRGKTIARFNSKGGNSFSLAKIPSGRFIVEAKQNGKKSSSAIILK